MIIVGAGRNRFERATAQNQWVYLAQAMSHRAIGYRQDFPKMGLVSCMVRRGGFEPPKAYSWLVYSQHPLTTWIPTREFVKSVAMLQIRRGNLLEESLHILTSSDVYLVSARLRYSVS